MKPGETIAPKSQKDSSDTKPAEQVSKITPKPDKKTEDKTASDQWQYSQDDADSPEQASEPYVQPVSWTASEYIAHQKGFGWFLLVLLVVIGLAGIVYLVTDELVSPVVILIIGIAFTAFAGRPPQTLEYSIDGTGIHISTRSYTYSRFRSFAILEDEPTPTIMLIPLRRFDLPINLHFDEADAEKIVNILGNYLPGEERNAPPVDRLMSKIRF